MLFRNPFSVVLVSGCLLSTYYVPTFILGSGDSVMNKTAWVLMSSPWGVGGGAGSILSHALDE